ncbi:lactonase family protein [Aspergillus ibericus CBS 121593]|uniref:Uncharacterized protein n=1 Tax=Aspergillus ibericus CBS 121593 TaxID=1448316 RepID=A0A395GIN8_9EURO|nr:hypothetical protein BO80DRAFT_266372 [Aspergillus ibericus CBS 121593]RAK95315.1 hypothetical protein BO80DRAFT_266372 [Aspergillus ibericus CBS 121593]
MILPHDEPLVCQATCCEAGLATADLSEARNSGCRRLTFRGISSLMWLRSVPPPPSYPAALSAPWPAYRRTSTTYVYVGSFVMPHPAKHEGLHVLRIEPETGALVRVASHVPGLKVGSLAVDHRRGVLYATDEVANAGQVYAFSIDCPTGDLTELGHWPSYGTQPAGIAGDAQSGYHMEQRYDDATTVLFPLDAAGCLGPPCDVYVHAVPGSLAPPSCLHSVSSSPDGTFLIEGDMEKDQLVTLVVDTAARSRRRQGIWDAPRGSGPRYSAFHPTLPVFYINYEYRPVLEIFAYRVGGELESTGTVDVLPEDLPSGPGVPSVPMAGSSTSPCP